MGSGFSKMKKQARLMQEQFETMQKEMDGKEFTGSSGNGLVTVTMNGHKEIKKILIKPECVDPKDVEGLQDLISAACSDAYKKADAEAPQSGGNLPFSL